jgi:hypothetical protein
MIKANNTFIKKAYLSLPIGQIHYRTNECLDGIPLILLHRTPSSSKMYEPMMKEMFYDRPIYAFDTPGFGSSFDPDGSPNMKNYCDWICECIDALGIDRFIFMHTTQEHTLLLRSQKFEKTKHYHLCSMVWPTWIRMNGSHLRK